MGWGIAVLWVCSFVPFDPLIAGYNVQNCQEMGGQAGPIDLAYLEGLGPDALPAVVYLSNHLTADAATRPADLDPDVEDALVESRSVWLERVDNPSADADREPSGDQTLGDELVAIRSRLTDALNEQLEGWRGWTVRRSWLVESASD